MENTNHSPDAPNTDTTNPHNEGENRRNRKTENKLSKLWGRLSQVQKEMVLFVGAPTIAVFLYASLWATPMYISETQFAVQSTTEAMGADFASQFLKVPGTTAKEAQIVTAFIRSSDAFGELDRRYKIADHYADRHHDWFTRLAGEATLYERDRYWANVSETVLDTDSGIVTFKVRAYTPEMAKTISQGILQLSETLINQMNERAHRDTLALAEEEVKRSQMRLDAARQAMRSFRDQNRELDPVATAGGLHEIAMQLEAQKAEIEAQITEAMGFMKPDAPAIRVLNNKLASLQSQLAIQKAKISQKENGAGALNQQLTEYQTLALEEEFAQKQVVGAMAAMESARINMLTKNKYVVTVESPTMPDEARYPAVLRTVLAVFFGLLLVFGLGRLIMASIREHTGY